MKNKNPGESRGNYPWNWKTKTQKNVVKKSPWKPVNLNQKIKPSGSLGKLLGCQGQLLGCPGRAIGMSRASSWDVRQAIGMSGPAIGMSYMSGWFLLRDFHVGKFIPYTSHGFVIFGLWFVMVQGVRKISDWYPVHSSSMILTWAKIAHVNPLSNVRYGDSPTSSPVFFRPSGPWDVSGIFTYCMNGRFVWYI